MDKKSINNLIRPYIEPSYTRAIFQILNTLIPYLGLITIMYFMIYYNVNYIFVLLIAILPALFLVRVFIFFHDCSHSSYVKSKRAMNILGTVFGILVFTSFKRWKKEHNYHHRTVGNIDKRGVGDVWTMTVDEYNESSTLKKLGYRLYRNPFVLFIVGPFYVFVISERFPRNLKTGGEWINYLITNIGILAIIMAVTFTVGFKYYLLIQLPIIFIAASLGVWLFYVQHQYEDVYWENSLKWSITDAALKGSSVYKLPRILNWFTGSIGYHNIHHLNARVPNYRLKKLFKSTSAFSESKQIKLFESLKLVKLFLYDVKSKKLISYHRYKKLQI